MSEVTRILKEVEDGNLAASEQLLPLVYQELRKLASAKLANEYPGQTLQATALVHEAYLRLLGADSNQGWDSKGHFFAAAAEAMRRILVEAARRKAREKHGGKHQRKEMSEDLVLTRIPCDELLEVHEALEKLVTVSPKAAQLVKLRYFAGFTIPETANIMQISPRKANQLWNYARAWLATEISAGN